MLFVLSLRRGRTINRIYGVSLPNYPGEQPWYIWSKTRQKIWPKIWGARRYWQEVPISEQQCKNDNTSLCDLDFIRFLVGFFVECPHWMSNIQNVGNQRPQNRKILCIGIWGCSYLGSFLLFTHSLRSWTELLIGCLIGRVRNQDRCDTFQNSKTQYLDFCLSVQRITPGSMNRLFSDFFIDFWSGF